MPILHDELKQLNWRWGRDSNRIVDERKMTSLGRSGLRSLVVARLSDRIGTNQLRDEAHHDRDPDPQHRFDEAIHGVSPWLVTMVQQHDSET
jgi:hypothetical protein